MTHIVCSEIMVRKAFTYSRLEQGSTLEKDLSGKEDERHSIFLFYHHGPRYEERPSDMFKLKLGILAVIFLLIGIMLEGG